MATYQFSIHVDAPPDRVFALCTDLDRMREWVGGVTRVADVSGPIDRPGTRYTVWFGRMRSPTEVLEVERPRRIRSRFGSVLLRVKRRPSSSKRTAGRASPRCSGRKD